MEMLERQVRHQGCGAARSAAADLFSFQILRPADFLSADKRLKRAIHGTRQNFRRRAADDGLNDAVDGRAVVDIAAHESRVDGLGGHKNRLQVDSLFAVETLVIGHVERQKADVGRLDAHPDFSESGLSMGIGYREKDREHQEPKHG